MPVPAMIATTPIIHLQKYIDCWNVRNWCDTKTCVYVVVRLPEYCFEFTCEQGFRTANGISSAFVAGSGAGHIVPSSTVSFLLYLSLWLGMFYK